MALVRCIKHSPPDSPDYVGYGFPLGFPNSAAICGRKNKDECFKEQGLVWLSADEGNSFNQGENIFSLKGHADVKIQVERTLGFFPKNWEV